MSQRNRAIAALVPIMVMLASCSNDEPKPAKAVSCKVSRRLVSGCGVWWGAYVAPDGHDDETSDAGVLQLERRIGRKLAIVHRYHDMSNRARGRFPDAAEQRLGAGRLLYLAWASRVYGGVNYTWRQVANGSLDRSVIDPQARRVAAYGRPIFIDFDHEPETPPSEDGSDAEFRAAYRHVHERFIALGATNAVWVWAVTGFTTYWDRYVGLYPGDDVVDWVAWDPYDFNVCHHASGRSFADGVGAFYGWLRDHHPTKPFMLAEYGTVSDPQDPGPSEQWYREVVPTLKDHPRIKAVLQFNQNPGGATGHGCDTRLRPRSVLQAWGEASHDPYVHPPLPGAATSRAGGS